MFGGVIFCTIWGAVTGYNSCNDGGGCCNINIQGCICPSYFLHLTYYHMVSISSIIYRCLPNVIGCMLRARTGVTFRPYKCLINVKKCNLTWKRAHLPVTCLVNCTPELQWGNLMLMWVQLPISWPLGLAQPIWDLTDLWIWPMTLNINGCWDMNIFPVTFFPSNLHRWTNSERWKWAHRAWVQVGSITSKLTCRNQKLDKISVFWVIFFFA